MRIRAIIFMLSIGLLATGCFSRSDDDDYNRYVNLFIEDALTADINENYIVGDTIFVELNFSRYLKEEGYSTLLDIYESTDSKGFYYDFEVSQFSSFSNQYEQVAIDSAYIVVEKGDYGSYYYNPSPIAILNPAEDAYESRVGLILPVAGEFRIRFDYLNLENFNNYQNDKINLAIFHEFSNPDDGIREFIVSE